MQIKEAVLLIGGSGFIGSNILDYSNQNDELLKRYKFVVLSRGFEKYLNDSAIYVTGDYSDKNILINLFSKWNFKKVIHCASSTTPFSSKNNILSDINGNLIATIVLLDVMKDFNCNTIIYLSSGGAVYGDKHTNKISEFETCEPLSSYGVVKLTIENYLRFYQKQFGINYLILRASNPFGKFHNSENQGIINIAIRRVIRGQSIEVWGDGNQTKDYIFADDLVKIIFLLLKKNYLNRIINVGSGQKYKLNGVLESIKTYLPKMEVKYVDSNSIDVKDFCLDITLLKSLIEFDFTEFGDAVQKTISWEKNKLNI